MKKGLKPGSIILGHNNAKYVLDYIPVVVEYLFSQGYEIVPLSELVLYGDTYIDSQGMQHPAKE